MPLASAKSRANRGSARGVPRSLLPNPDDRILKRSAWPQRRRGHAQATLQCPGRPAARQAALGSRQARLLWATARFRYDVSAVTLFIDTGRVFGGTWPPSVLANRYVVNRSLGQGGMGSVWQAEDLTLKRTVAIKLIQMSSQADEKARIRFTREAQSAAGLTHPNIVTVHDFGIDEGVAFMVMEFLPGPDLASLVRSSGPLPLDLALSYLGQVASGLAAAHAAGILHRDVKPANLMLTAAGSVKVLDFGIAAVAERPEQLTTTNQMIGTLSYLAPERSMGSPASVQSDLYALGCVAMTLLTGAPPFGGTSGQILLKHLNGVPPRLSSLRPDVPRGLEGLIDALLAKDPAQRPHSAGEVVDRLNSIQRQATALRAQWHNSATSWPPVAAWPDNERKGDLNGDTVQRPKRVHSAEPTNRSAPAGQHPPDSSSGLGTIPPSVTPVGRVSGSTSEVRPIAHAQRASDEAYVEMSRAVTTVRRSARRPSDGASVGDEPQVDQPARPSGTDGTLRTPPQSSTSFHRPAREESKKGGLILGLVFIVALAIISTLAATTLQFYP